MKKIIDGKVYDTEKAERIVGYSENGYDSRDFDHIEKAVYRTKSGQFFEFVEGGARTEYATHEARTSYPGRHMRLLTEAEFVEWLETNSSQLSDKEIDSALSVLELPEG